MRIIAAIVAFFVFASVSSADSLYPTSTGATPDSIFADVKAHKVGDPLTVVINENSAGAVNAGTQASKTEAANVGPGFGPLLSLLTNFGANSSLSSTAAGTSTRTDTLAATVAVVIKQVNPNGTMVIEGTKTVGTNSDVEVITLTGLIRVQDVASDNTVQSPLVANAMIHYSGKGPVGDKQHNGFITRLLKGLF